MTTGKELEKYNLTSKEMAEYYNKDIGTIRNWFRDNRRLFDSAVIGLVAYKVNN